MDCFSGGQNIHQPLMCIHTRTTLKREDVILILPSNIICGGQWCDIKTNNVFNIMVKFGRDFVYGIK